MNIPTTLLNDLAAKVEVKVLETYIKADAIWQRQFELPRLLFDLRGCCAGRGCYRDYQIRLNPVLLLKNQTDFVEQTVFHEVVASLPDGSTAFVLNLTVGSGSP